MSFTQESQTVKPIGTPIAISSTLSVQSTVDIIKSVYDGWIVGSTGGHGTRAISNRYPAVTGLTGASYILNAQPSLIPTKSYVPRTQRI